MDGLADAAKKYTDYEMIRAYTSLPEFPALRSKMLRAFLRYGGDEAPPHKLEEAVALATSLAQLGLDTHERVNDSPTGLGRQMTVLAGDYFSSIFYHLLAQADSVHSIGKLSHSICEVNRIKMHVYRKAKRLLLTAEEYIRHTVEINTHLFLSFTEWMNSVCRNICPAIMQALAECELIASELKRTRPDNVKESWSYWYMLEYGTEEEITALVSGTMDEYKLQAIFNKYNLIGKLTDMWESKVSELRSLLRSAGPDKLKEELLHMAEPLFAIGKTSRVLEEI